jgi:hypothetical protein
MIEWNRFYNFSISLWKEKNILIQFLADFDSWIEFIAFMKQFIKDDSNLLQNFPAFFVTRLRSYFSFLNQIEDNQSAFSENNLVFPSSFEPYKLNFTALKFIASYSLFLSFLSDVDRLPYFTFSMRISQNIFNQFFRILPLFSPQEMSGEYLCLTFLSKFDIFLKRFQKKLFKIKIENVSKMKTIQSFLNYLFLTRCSFNYSLMRCFSKETVYQLTTICLDFDSYDSMLDFISN